MKLGFGTHQHLVDCTSGVRRGAIDVGAKLAQDDDTLRNITQLVRTTGLNQDFGLLGEILSMLFELLVEGSLPGDLREGVETRDRLYELPAVEDFASSLVVLLIEAALEPQVVFLSFCFHRRLELLDLVVELRAHLLNKVRHLRTEKRLKRLGIECLILLRIILALQRLLRPIDHRIDLCRCIAPSSFKMFEGTGSKMLPPRRRGRASIDRALLGEGRLQVSNDLEHALVSRAEFRVQRRI